MVPHPSTRAAMTFSPIDLASFVGFLVLVFAVAIDSVLNRRQQR